MNVNIPKTLLVAASCAFIWGIWFLYPFGNVLTNPLYSSLVFDYIGVEGSEIVWGTYALLSAILPFIRFKKPFLRNLSYSLLFSFFISLAMGISVSSLQAPAVGINVVLALSALDGMYNARSDS